MALTDPSRLWQFYTQLVCVEDALRNLKGNLAMRPIYHQTEAHIFVAFMAYCLHVTLAQRIKTRAPGLTSRSVLEQMKAMQMLDVRVPTTDARWLPPDDNAAHIT